MKRGWIAMSLLLVIFPLLTIELKNKAHAHAGHNHYAQTLTASAQRAAQTTTVEFGGVLGFAYNPQHSFILPGDTIRWLGEFAMHPLVSDEALWQQVSNGSEFSFTFNQPGKYSYHCFFHGSFGMNGTVTVGTTYFLPLLMN
jgi:plastocyanin